MISVARDLYFTSPRGLSQDKTLPKTFHSTTLPELCKKAGIPCRVTLSCPPEVLLHKGEEHFSLPGKYFVGVPGGKVTKMSALRVIEVLAYGFHDYGARETVCGKGIFK